MKKVFLLLASALMGVATFAGNVWSFDEANKKIDVEYNMYGTKDAEGTSIQWQAGNQGVLADAVEDVTGSVAWVPALGEAFSVSIKGVASNTGKLQMCIVDEREIANYYTELTGTYVSAEVVKGQPFTLEGVMFIEKIQITTEKNGDVDLTAPGLVLGFLYGGVSTDDGFNSADPFTISDAEMEVTFAEAANYENPLLLTNIGKSPADDTKLQYQFLGNSKVAPDKVKAGAYANVTFKGKAINDVATLMYVLADNSLQKPDADHANGWYFAQTTADFVSFAANIKAGQDVKFEFSYALEKGTNPEDNSELVTDDKKGPTFVDCLLAESSEKLMGVYFENGSIDVEITDEPKFDAPHVDAVEEVSNVVFENGVIYSSSIVVFDQAGKKVAVASESFAINTLKAGIYFAKTAEGAISFVVK